MGVRGLIAKRMRYYQGIIDLNNLEKGMDYESLPKSIILFICTFDYFRKGLPVYTFGYYCKELPELSIGDETSKVFVNLSGNTVNLDGNQEALFAYFGGQAATDIYTRKLDLAVNKARHNKDWEVEYMNWRAFEMDIEIDKRHAREEGRAEGIAEGRTEGRAEGKAEGIKLINKLRICLKNTDRLEEFDRIFEDSEFFAKLVQEFGLVDEQ